MARMLTRDRKTKRAFTKGRRAGKNVKDVKCPVFPGTMSGLLLLEHSNGLGNFKEKLWSHSWVLPGWAEDVVHCFVGVSQIYP